MDEKTELAIELGQSIYSNTINSLNSKIARLTDELAAAKALSVQNILLDITPGFDGMGQGVCATSVDQVVGKLGELALKVESLGFELAASQARANGMRETSRYAANCFVTDGKNTRLLEDFKRHLTEKTPSATIQTPLIY